MRVVRPIGALRTDRIGHSARAGDGPRGADRWEDYGNAGHTAPAVGLLTMRRFIKPLAVAVPAALAMAFAPNPPEPAHGTHAPVAKPVGTDKPPVIKRIEGPAAKPAIKEPVKEPAKEPVKEAHTAPAAKEPLSEPQEIDGEQALKLLREGNQRWVDGKPLAPNTSDERLRMLADKGQTPFVTIITCSDSRIPVERVFDRGAGDLFVVRVAGNRAGASEAGTVEYGIEHLKTPVLLVMGHTKCGAVAAAASGAHLHGKVAELVRGIEPAVERTKRNNPGAAEKTIVSLAVKENVWQTIKLPLQKTITRTFLRISLFARTNMLFHREMNKLHDKTKSIYLRCRVTKISAFKLCPKLGVPLDTFMCTQTQAAAAVFSAAVL